MYKFELLLLSAIYLNAILSYLSIFEIEVGR